MIRTMQPGAEISLIESMESVECAQNIIPLMSLHSQ